MLRSIGHLVTMALAAARPSSNPTSAIVFSAGQTDYAVLAAAPASSSLYGFAFPASFGVAPMVSLTLAAANGTVVASVVAALADAGAGDVCDATCYDEGYLSGVGTSSCCAAPTCPMGCAIGSVVPSLAACNAQCANVSGCSYTVPGTNLTLDTCEGCLAGCPGKSDCEAGCAARFASGPSPQAWKALLPPQVAGGDYTITATCSNCVQGAAPSRVLHHVTFGSVFYCSGQSNMASPGAWGQTG
jgi:hypothetical protein